MRYKKVMEMLKAQIDFNNKITIYVKNLEQRIDVLENKNAYLLNKINKKPQTRRKK